MAALERGNGLDTAYTYYGATGNQGNAAFRLQRLATGSLLDLSYQYDPMGNITHITDNLLLANKTQQSRPNNSATTPLTAFSTPGRPPPP